MLVPRLLSAVYLSTCLDRPPTYAHIEQKVLMLRMSKREVKQ